MYKVWTWSQQGNRRTEDGRQKRDRSLGWIWNAKVKAARTVVVLYEVDVPLSYAGRSRIRIRSKLSYLGASVLRGPRVLANVGVRDEL